MFSPARTNAMRLAIVVILAMEVVGGWFFLCKDLVLGYEVSCQKDQKVVCTLRQDTLSGMKTWVVPMDPGAHATVQVKPVRRSGPLVHLYLNTPTQSVFAAQFIDAAPQAHARAAADQLNQVLASPSPASTTVKIQHPVYKTWGALALFGVFMVLSGLVVRLLFKKEPS